MNIEKVKIDQVLITVGETILIVRSRDVNVLIFLDFSFRYDSAHQKY